MATWLTVESANNTGSRIRMLHVSKEYSSYENLDLSVILDNLHKKMVKKFKAISNGAGRRGAGSQAEAAQLNAFFNDIKQLDKKGDKASLVTGIEKQVLESILSTTKNLMGKTRGGKLFTSNMGWKDFEAAIGAIATATVSQAGNVVATKQMFQSTQTGSAAFIAGKLNTNIAMHIAENLVETHAAKISSTLQKQIKYSRNGYVDIKLNNKTITGGVVDINGRALAEIKISAKPNDKLTTIARLLQSASFSAKNYSESFYSFRLKQVVQMQEREIALKLGHSNLDTTFQALFQNELPPPVILSLFFYTQYTHKPQLRFAVAHLRFIYELTGYGQHYIDQTIEQTFKADFDGDNLFRANYLIWNNPSSDTIVVKSTADLITWAYEHYYAELDQSIYLPVNGILI